MSTYPGWTFGDQAWLKRKPDDAEAVLAHVAYIEEGGFIEFQAGDFVWFLDNETLPLFMVGDKIEHL